MKVHETKVRVNLKGLKEELPSLWAEYEKIGNRDTTEGRSKFSVANNLQHFYDRYVKQQDSNGFVILDVVGECKGASARVYYTPSITSLAKPIRKFVVPLHDNHVFAYCDIAAAEFGLQCYYAGETEAFEEYKKGGDIYMHYAKFFPQGTSRQVIKRCLIGNLYGISAYRIAQQTGITQNQAERLLFMVQKSIPNIEQKKFQIIMDARRNHGYFCPDKFDQSHLIKIADEGVKKQQGINPLLALSAYTQSGLAQITQSLIHDLEPRVEGTILTVFDSVFVECKPESKDRLFKFLQSKVYPLHFDGIHLGKTMYEAQYGN